MINVRPKIFRDPYTKHGFNSLNRLVMEQNVHLNEYPIIANERCLFIVKIIENREENVKIIKLHARFCQNI